MSFTQKGFEKEPKLGGMGHRPVALGDAPNAGSRPSPNASTLIIRERLAMGITVPQVLRQAGRPPQQASGPFHPGSAECRRHLLLGADLPWIEIALRLFGHFSQSGA